MSVTIKEIDCLTICQISCLTFLFQCFDIYGNRQMIRDISSLKTH